MPFNIHGNLGYSTVTTPPSPASSGGSVTVADGAVFPAAPFPATVWPVGELPLASNAEIVLVTAKVGNVLSITRQHEGTAARAIQTGDQIAATVTAGDITAIEDAIPSIAGLISAVVLSAGLTSAALSAVTFSNTNGVSFGLTNGVVTGSVGTNYQTPGAYLTTAALSQDSSKYAGTAGAITGGSLTLNTAGMSISLPPYLTTAMQSNAATLSNVRLSAGTLSTHRSDVTFSNANGVSFGLETNGVVTGSVATNYQSQGAYLTTAALSQDSSKYAGTNGAITGGSITVNTAGVSVNLPAYLTTAMASNRGTDFVQANAAFAGTNASGTIASNGISVSVAAPSGGIAAALSGNTAGVMATVSTGTVILAGGNNITVSQDGQSITISGPNVGGAQTGISGIAAAGGTVTSGTASFVNSNGVSFSVDGQSIIATVRTDYQSAGAYLTTAMQSNAVTLSNIRVSAGTTSNLLSAVTFSNGNGVSFGLDAGTITATVATNYLTTAMASNRGTDFVQANAAFAGTSASGTIASNGISISIGPYLTTAALSSQTLMISLSGNIATTNSSRVSAGGYALAGGNGVTIQQSNNTVSISVATNYQSQGAYLTTARASNDAIGLNTAGTNVTWTANSSGLSLNAAGYAGTGFTSTTTAGTAIVGTNNTGGLSIGVPAFLTTAALSDHSHGNPTLALTNLTGTTASASNGFTLSLSGVAAQSVQSVGAYGLGNTTGQSSSSTVDARSLSFSGAGNISLGMSAGALVISGGTAAAAPLNFSAGTTSNNLGSVIFSNSNGLSFGLNGSTITAGANTVGTATAAYAVGSNNSVGTVTRWAAEDHRHAGIGAIGISTSGTAGTTGSVQGTYWFQGGQNITVSQITSNNGSHSLAISGPSLTQYLTTAMASNGGSNFVAASAAFAGTNASGTIASDGISVSIVPQATLSYWRNVAAELVNGTTTQSYSGSTSYMVPFVLENYISASYFRVLMSLGVSNTTTIATSANATGSASIMSTLFAAVYSRGTGASSMSLQLLTSGTAGITQVWSLSAGNGSQWTLSQSIMHPITGGMSTFTTGVTTSLTNYSLGSASLTRFTGLQKIDIPFATLMSPGNYWLALGQSSATSTGGSGAAFSQLRMSNSVIGVTQINSAVAFMGQVTASSQPLLAGMGSFSTNAIGVTASVPFSVISSSASHPYPPFAFIRIT